MRLHTLFRRYGFAVILLAYVLAALYPQRGLAWANHTLVHLEVMGAHCALTVPALTLAILLFNSGLSLTYSRIQSLWQKPRLVLVSLAAALALPLSFSLLAAVLLHMVSAAHDTVGMLMGLVLIASVPVAASSPAWAHHGDANLALSLALLLGSTLLCPLVTSWALATAAPWVELQRLTRGHGHSTGLPLLMLCMVFLPLLAGSLGGAALRRYRPLLESVGKAVNIPCLFLLNYIGCSVAVPDGLKGCEWHTLAQALSMALVYSALCFWGASQISRWLGGSPADRVSIMLGVGMRNTGAALVLATTFANRPEVALTIVTCGLTQECIGIWLSRQRTTAMRRHFESHGV